MNNKANVIELQLLDKLVQARSQAWCQKNDGRIIITE